MLLEAIGLDVIGNLRGLTGGDLLLLFAIIIIWPIYIYVSLKRNPVEKLRQDPNARLSSYNYTLLQLWGLAIAILLIWGGVQRPYEMLGFRHEFDLATGIAWGVAVFGIVFSAVQLYQAVNNEEAREKLSRQLSDVGEYTDLLMPKTQKEYRRSLIVGITAGITEEIIFRGYIIWAFSLFIHQWVAGALSVCLFVFLHRYQDRAGLIQVAVFAMVTTVMYLACGSLWPVIALHIGVDILNITLAWHIGKMKRDSELLTDKD